MQYILYNNDVPVGEFEFSAGTITSFTPKNLKLLPKQLVLATADMFAL